MAEYEGGCACGSLRFRMADEPIFVNCCHCRECQKITGSAFAINAVIEADRLELLSGSDTHAAGRQLRCDKCA
ncbi:MAG TPA: GFA family protein, partial [Sphingomicrobium sp.]|nr:GFA family protein [Sphingomicrobium sp.]